MSKLSQANLFELDDYRGYIDAWVRTKPRGEFRRISLALDMHTTLISQIVNGKKCFTEEQALKLCGYMGLNNLESDYFLKLVQIERAGTESLKSIYKRHLKEIKSKAKDIVNVVPQARELTEHDKAIYYSSWQYTMVRLLTSIEEFQTVEAISEHLELTISRVQEILSFLTSRGLCQQSKNRFVRTEQNTHVEARSSLSTRHHMNWRAKSLSLLEELRVDDMAFTAPVSISEEDFPKVREVLVRTISDISKIVKESEAEAVAYLGIDWIRL